MVTGSEGLLSKTKPFKSEIVTLLNFVVVVKPSRTDKLEVFTESIIDQESNGLVEYSHRYVFNPAPEPSSKFEIVCGVAPTQID